MIMLRYLAELGEAVETFLSDHEGSITEKLAISKLTAFVVTPNRMEKTSKTNAARLIMGARSAFFVSRPFVYEKLHGLILRTSSIMTFAIFH